MSDGLVSNVSLILGVAGAHPNASGVILAGVAGLVAGSCSMAAGEYISMAAQKELFQRELAVERSEIANDPQGEHRELRAIYEDRGASREVAEEVSRQMMRDPETALESHARDELGLDPAALGSPLQAAASSFFSFAVGAVIPLLPWFLGLAGHGATLASVLLAVVASGAVGATISTFTGRSWLVTAGRQMLLAGAAAAITYGVGTAIGTSLGT